MDRKKTIKITHDKPKPKKGDSVIVIHKPGKKGGKRIKILKEG